MPSKKNPVSLPEAPLSSLPFNILTDLPSPAEWHKRARKASGADKTLDLVLGMVEQRHLKHGAFDLPLDEQDPLLSEVELLYYLVTETRPILTVETGLGKGLAAAVMILGHMHNKLNGGHVPLQKKTDNTADNPGIAVLESLPLTGYQIMDHESALVLPQMYLQQLNDGLTLGYVNNATDFDVVMMEYFFLNRLLNEGGIIAIDTRVRARQALVTYLREERHDYAVRTISDTLTLVQKPRPIAMGQHMPATRH